MTKPNYAKLEQQVRAAKLQPSTSDDRDYVFTPRVSPTQMVCIPHQAYFPRIEDQGQEGVCTGETITTVCETILNYGAGSKDDARQLSPQFNYYWSRQYDGHTGDVGASPRSMCRSAKNFGLCLDYLWPLTKPVDQAPDDVAMQDASTRKGLTYEVIAPNLDDMYDLANQVESAIAEGLLVTLAFYCRRWMFYVKGPLGSIGHQAPAMGNTDPMNDIVGGHIVAVRGYDRTLFKDSAGSIIIQNSWGTGWGDGGLWSIPIMQLIAPGFAMETRVIRAYNGITLAPPPEVILTQQQLNDARALLASLGLGTGGASGFTFSPNPNMAYAAAWEALARRGFTAHEAAQIAGINPTVVDAFLADPANKPLLSAWSKL